MPRRLLPPLCLSIALALGIAAPASALKTGRCRRSTEFRCGTVTVPLDRSGTVPGRVRLGVAVEPPRRGATGWLIALAGGPGQPSVPFADSFRSTLSPALAHRRLVVLDQRGTGLSGVLDCAPLQKLGTLDPVNTFLVQTCMDRLGPARRFYSTPDSVLDLDAVRHALGARKVELMGVSYGTYVAEQYARRYPTHTDGLILDSVVGPDGIDPYFLDTFERLPRILREQCARDRCAGATKDPVKDLGRLTARLTRGPLRGPVVTPGGTRVQTAVHDESELLLMVMSGDLNPFLQAAFPGAINAAIHHDPAPLLRLRRVAQGPYTPAKDFSGTLNVATTCADVPLPYTMQTPLDQRFTAWRHGVDALPAAAYAPFSRHAVIDTSVVHDCLRWPVGDVLTHPFTAPLPDVPTLLLSGRLDTRTPVENSREMLGLLPHAQLLTVPGTGHDILDSDITGCAARALHRFASGASIGTPCRGRSNAVSVLARPPRSLSAYRAAPGVGGARGRALYATLDTVLDAQISALQTLYGGWDPVSGGGLRGGRFSASPSADSVRLRDYEYLRGLRVSGRVSASGGAGSGVVTVDGPGRLDGTLHLHANGVVTGTLEGRRVRYDGRRSHAGAARAGAGRVARRLALPSLRAAARRVALLHALR